MEVKVSNPINLYVFIFHSFFFRLFVFIFIYDLIYADIQFINLKLNSAILNYAIKKKSYEQQLIFRDNSKMSISM